MSVETICQLAFVECCPGIMSRNTGVHNSLITSPEPVPPVTLFRVLRPAPPTALSAVGSSPSSWPHCRNRPGCQVLLPIPLLSQCPPPAVNFAPLLALKRQLRAARYEGRFVPGLASFRPRMLTNNPRLQAPSSVRLIFCETGLRLANLNFDWVHSFVASRFLRFSQHLLAPLFVPEFAAFRHYFRERYG